LRGTITVLRSTIVAILVSGVAVLALAPGARAIAPGRTQALPYDGDHEDSHAAGPSDNPYDEPSPQRPMLARISVPTRDGMVRLPGGRFTMGSSNPHAPINERPARAVTVAPFWMDRTEVTVGALRTCVDAHICARPARMSATCTYDANDRDLPVSCVHWDEAEAYCRFADKRLPTEVEWEYAARGPFRVSYPWGGAAACANAVTLVYDQSARSCGARPARVGSHPGGASVFGVEDLSGNVEEWTADWYAESLGPGPGPRAGAAHVLRGGGWLSPPSLSRTTSRDWGSAMEAGPNVGFRCAKDAEPTH
jgi:formylglycine-generating enzyme required for sulfatase activity